MSTCRLNPTIEFEHADIEHAMQNKELLSMEIELSLRCNFRCPYCYVPDKETLQNELSLAELCDVIDQAHSLGARKIILLGGEPMLYPYLFDIIEYIAERNMDIEMFTNGFGITTGIAQRLFKYKVSVALKMNTFDEKKQDELAGHNGAFTIIQDAFRNLCTAGYPSENPFLAVSTIICKQNIDELAGLWQWLRDQDVLPYFEMITPQGDALEHDDMNPPLEDVEDLFRQIEKIDREKYGIKWDAQPPLVGSKCLRHLFSCLVTSQGDVNPCVGVTIPVGNIRDKPLKEILAESEVINNLRKHTVNIKGPCGNCDKASDCYGCRGAAYNLTGDYLASDPLCWEHGSKETEIDYLPFAVNTIIPQKGAMRVIDTLDSVGEGCATSSLVVRSDMLFCNSDGTLDTAVYIEMAAQTVAAMNGFMERENSKEQLGGYLLGAKKFKIYAAARVGDRILVEVVKQTSFGDFNIIGGIVRDESGKVLAEGEIKIYEIPEGGVPQ